VAINVYTGPSKELPYGTTYLPGTTDVISATMIQVQADQHVEHLTLQLSAAQRLHERKFPANLNGPMDALPPMSPSGSTKMNTTSN